MKTLHRRSALTLVEVLVVIAILAVLFGMVLAAVLNSWLAAILKHWPQGTGASLPANARDDRTNFSATILGGY